ncbi:MAG: hypothetical protein H6492_03185 [Candidatus Paracaedibacteraceae bacterium]|nr:hypothetical protein [Candidatus Paracaedibacteraceae bacterium]
MRIYASILGVLVLLITSTYGDFNGGYIKGSSAIGFSYLKYTQPPSMNGDSLVTVIYPPEPKLSKEKPTIDYSQGVEITLLSLAAGYGNVVNDKGLYLGLELNAKQDMTMSGLFVNRFNLLGRVGWEIMDNILPYAAIGFGGTDLGAKENYEKYPHLVSSLGIDIKLWGFIITGPVLDFYVSLNDMQEFKYSASAKIKLELQYSF